MQYKEWPFIEANRISNPPRQVRKEKGRGRDRLWPIRSSAHRHVGEVARTSFVLQALKNIRPDIDPHLIAFSDDMDGLREAPKNIPNRGNCFRTSWQTLNDRPRPVREEESYAHNMNRKLKRSSIHSASSMIFDHRPTNTAPVFLMKRSVGLWIDTKK